jgi:hypothetical protein
MPEFRFNALRVACTAPDLSAGRAGGAENPFAGMDSLSQQHDSPPISCAINENPKLDPRAIMPLETRPDVPSPGPTRPTAPAAAPPAVELVQTRSVVPLPEPIEGPMEAMIPPGKPLKGHKWSFSKEFGCAFCTHHLDGPAWSSPQHLPVPVALTPAPCRMCQVDSGLAGLGCRASLLSPGDEKQSFLCGHPDADAYISMLKVHLINQTRAARHTCIARASVAS